MNALLVLLILQSVGATIRKEGDGLAIEAPPGAISLDLQEAIAACKADLLVILAKPQAVAA
jgi:hypothetical protein